MRSCQDQDEFTVEIPTIPYYYYGYNGIGFQSPESNYNTDFSFAKGMKNQPLSWSVMNWLWDEN
jgi:hypothetical protein